MFQYSRDRFLDLALGTSIVAFLILTYMSLTNIDVCSEDNDNSKDSTCAATKYETAVAPRKEEEDESSTKPTSETGCKNCKTYYEFNVFGITIASGLFLITTLVFTFEIILYFILDSCTPGMVRTTG